MIPTHSAGPQIRINSSPPSIEGTKFDPLVAANARIRRRANMIARSRLPAPLIEVEAPYCTNRPHRPGQ
jgi:hypothetical protein